MFDGHVQGSEFQKAQARHEEGATQAHEEISANIASLMRSALIGASYNAPVRAAAMQGLQQTHGNRAVQRARQTSGLISHIAVQRDSTEDEEAKDARKGRTAVSNTARTLREGTKAAYGLSVATGKKETDAWHAYVEALKKGNTADTVAKIGAHNNAQQAKEAADAAASTGKGKFGAFMEKNTGSKSPVGKGLSAANYGLQFWQNMAQGQDLGESAFGAAGGGFMANYMPRYLFNANSPKVFGQSSRGVGWADTAINLVNAGLNLIPGMPEEVTTVTQTVADATPSSFGTSVVSNAGRGMWNLGEGLITGDWSDLKQQGEDMTHGKAGAPLQGYASAVEAFSVLASGDDAAHDRIVEENRSGKRGKLAQWGSKLGRGAREATDWAGDKWDSWMGRGTRAQRENAEERKFAVHLEHLKEARKEREQKAAFEAEMAEITAQIEKGPAIPGTMLGGPGDALSARAIAAPFLPHDEDEDGEPMPHVSMALPTKRR